MTPKFGVYWLATTESSRRLVLVRWQEMADQRQPYATFVALLRAVNVGGTSKAWSVDLNSAAEAIGLRAVQPSTADGKLIFRAGHEPKAVGRQT